MITIKDKQDCCGCSTCASICPINAIIMKEDEEGFLYPQIDTDACINCGKCEKVCPVANKKEETPFEQKGYIVQNKNERVLRESTSGGAFTAIARYIIAQNGVVFGATLSDTLSVCHDWVDNEDDLLKFRNSKYVQSELRNTFVQVKAFLEKGKMVCFSGTPCQVEGLVSYLGRDYDNLITVDVVCRAVPSPLVYRKYLEYQEASLGGRIIDIRFRDKAYGYKYSTMKVVTEENQGRYNEGMDTDVWLRAFFSGMCLRPSCYCCQFKKRYRVSDFTIWDCFQVGRFSKELDNDKGATRMLVHTEKGKKVFEQISKDIRYVAVLPEEMIKTTAEMFNSVKYNDRRPEFMKDASLLDSEHFFRKYFPNTMKVKSERMIRMVCYKLGIYSIVKKAYVKITHKY